MFLTSCLGRFCFALFLPIFLMSSQDDSADEYIQDTIRFESSLIREIPSKDIENLSNAYLSRAESYLLCNQAELALKDLYAAYQLSLAPFLDEKLVNLILFRTFFGMTIAYCNLDMEEQGIEIADELSGLIESLQCKDCQETHLACNFTGIITFCSEILGPNYNVPGWCEEIVRGTADTMRFLASLAKSNQAKLTLFGSISALETKCLKCCATGEFWKVCVAPIVEKWKKWNDKYQLFQIPPDPMWD